jgi:hypothetical protein
VSVQGIEDRGHRLKTCSSETSTPQYIIYNIKKWVCLIAHVVQRKPTLLNASDLTLSLPPPDPTRKKHPQPTQNDFPSRLPHHQCPDPGADSLSSPHLRMNYADLAEDSYPWTNKRPRVSAVKNTHLKPSCHSAGTTTKHLPHHTQPNVCPCNGPGLPTHPPQSGGQPTHLPLLPRPDVKRTTRRQDPQKS